MAEYWLETKPHHIVGSSLKSFNVSRGDFEYNRGLVGNRQAIFGGAGKADPENTRTENGLSWKEDGKPVPSHKLSDFGRNPR